MILSGTTSSGQRGPKTDGNDGVVPIPQSSKNTGVSQSNCLMSYTGRSFGKFLPSAETPQCILEVRPTGHLWWCNG